MRRIGKAAAAAVAMAMVTACGGNGETTSTAPSESASDTMADAPSATEPVELTFWNYWDGNNGEVMQALVDEFNADRAAVQVENVFIGFDDLLPKLQTATSGGQAPDVAAGDLIWIPKLVESGRLADLSDAVEADRFFAEMLEPGSDGGVTYSVPVSSNNLQLFTNKELLESADLDPESPPTSWEELQEVAGTCADPENGVQGLELFTEPGEGLTWQFQTYLWEAGGEFLDDDQTAAAFNSPEGEEALQLWLDLIDSGASSVAPWGAFGQGNACMVLDGSWMVGILSGDPPFEFGTATMPYPSDGGPATNMGGEQLFVMAEDPAQQQAAKDFVSYLTSDEVQRRWTEETGFTPVLTAQTDDSDYLSYIEDNQPRLMPFVEGAADARSRPSIPNYPEVSDVFSRQLERALLGDVTAGEALTNAEQAVNDQLGTE